ncbi:MAG: RNA methyltransferase [Thiobacillus sp.]|nr:RNA methyltransferase [Thiobacillus sp.]
MSVKHISSRENPLFREWLGLAESRQVRRERGQTLLDGEHLLEEASRTGIIPRYLIVDPEMAGIEARQDELAHVPVVALASALFKRLSPVSTPTGLLAVIDIPVPQSRALGGCAVLLDDIQDPGNLGALLRTAAAAGVAEVFLSKGCADAWSPKALRGGQGGHFRLGIHEGCDLVASARDRAGPVYAAALRCEHELYDLDLTGPVAFAFGNEGAGLGEALLRETRTFSIPMAGAVESLNVAAAAAVCLFERLRQVRQAEVKA